MSTYCQDLKFIRLLKPCTAPARFTLTKVISTGCVASTEHSVTTYCNVHLGLPCMKGFIESAGIDAPKKCTDSIISAKQIGRVYCSINI